MGHSNTVRLAFGSLFSIVFGKDRLVGIVVKGDQMLKISVKGSQDGGWGLTQGYKKDSTYHEAADKWLAAHHRGTIFCLVQFENVPVDAQPRVYLATPSEIAQRLKSSAGGRGETILYEHHEWSDRAAGAGTIDEVPECWKFTSERIKELFKEFGL